MSLSSCQWERLHHQHWKEEMRSPPPHQPCRFQALLENVLQHHACLGISSHLCNSLARQFKGHITNSVTIWRKLQVLTGMHHEGSTGTQTVYMYITQYLPNLVHNAAILSGPPTITNPFVGSCWTLLDLLVTSHRSWQLFSFSPSEDLVLHTSSVANPWSSTSKRSESKQPHCMVTPSTLGRPRDKSLYFTLTVTVAAGSCCGSEDMSSKFFTYRATLHSQSFTQTQHGNHELTLITM